MIGGSGYTLLVRDVTDRPSLLTHLLLGSSLLIFGGVLMTRSDFVVKRCLVGLVLRIYFSGHLDIASELGLGRERVLLLLNVHIAVEGELEHHRVVILHCGGLTRRFLF